ncbi:MAG: glycosyltransferase family 2 protein [Candidatus Omnitrophica bacterium]|nr:glycosyltransferase family 2 protein [Candidatus Omnitrophota bacterium]
MTENKTDSIQLSVIIPVKNEAANLDECLRSVDSIEDVVVVDSNSSDGTVEIAQQHGRRVLQFDWNGRFPKKRNWVLRKYPPKQPWVLFLDADERLTQEFIDELQLILPHTSHNGFWIGYRNWFLGRLLQYGDPMRKIALFRVGHAEYEEIQEESWSRLDMEVHEQPVVQGSTGMLQAKLEHYDKRQLRDYYARHNEYAAWEAHRFLTLKSTQQLNGRQKMKYKMLAWPIFPVIYFLATYIFKGGILDGRAGYLFAISKMFYFFQIETNIFALKNQGQTNS